MDAGAPEPVERSHARGGRPRRARRGFDVAGWTWSSVMTCPSSSTCDIDFIRRQMETISSVMQPSKSQTCDVVQRGWMMHL